MLPTAMLYSLSNDWGTDEVPVRSTGVMLAILQILRATGTRVSLEGIRRNIEKARHSTRSGATRRSA